MTAHASGTLISTPPLLPFDERLLGHRCFASWAGWRLRHEVIRVDAAEQHHAIQDGFNVQSASGLQASQEATWAMAAFATLAADCEYNAIALWLHVAVSRSLYFAAHSSAHPGSILRFVWIVRFDLDDLAFNPLQFLVLRLLPPDDDGSTVSASDLEMFGRLIERPIHQIGKSLNVGSLV